MRTRLQQKWTALLVASSFGSLFAFGCVTDAQFRDFLTTNVIRTTLTAVGSALQAAFVATQGTG